MRADAVGRMLAAANQSSFFDAVDAEYAAAGIGRVVLGGVEPVAAGVEHAVAVEMTVGWRRDHLQQGAVTRSEEHTSELQSLMRISYALFCLKKKNKHNT